MRSFETLIDCGELETRLGDDGLRVIDCRFSLLEPEKGRRDYEAGHVPGAVYAHLDDDLAAPVSEDSGRHPLPDTGKFVARLRDWGVSNDSQVVVYDDASGGLAARLWWMLRWLGHRRVAVLDGGYAAWEAAGKPVSRAQPDPDPGTFEGRPRPAMVISADEIRAGLESRDGLVLVDARDAARFRGEAEPIDDVAGHIPGALNLPFSLAMAPDGRWKSAEELRRLWRQVAPIDEKHDWAVMCGSGVTACHLALSAELAGLPEPRVYVGSWSEWIRDPRRAVAAESG